MDIIWEILCIYIVIEYISGKSINKLEYFIKNVIVLYRDYSVDNEYILIY